MREDEFDRLVNDELDGVATPEDKAALARQLAASETARARYQEIQTVFGMLDRIESVDPPPSLRGGVLRTIESRARTRSGSRSFWDLLRGGLGKRPGLGLGYAFAAGAVVGALVLAVGTGLFDRAGLPGAEVGGTMLPPQGRRVDTVHLAVKGAEARGEAWTAGRDLVAVRLETRAVGPFEAHVSFDPEHYVPMSFRRIEPSGGRLELRRGDLEMGDRSGGRIELVLRAVGRERPPVGVEIRTDDARAQGMLDIVSRP